MKGKILRVWPKNYAVQNRRSPYPECVTHRISLEIIPKVLIILLIFIYTATMCLVWSHQAWLILVGCLAVAVGAAALLRRYQVRQRRINEECRESLIRRLGETMQDETERLTSGLSSPE